MRITGNTALHCSILHCTALYCIIIHFTALLCTTLPCTKIHYLTVLHNCSGGRPLGTGETTQGCTGQSSLISTRLHLTALKWCTNIYLGIPLQIKKISRLRRLQTQTLSDATPPISKIPQFSKITFEQIMQFLYFFFRFRIP